MNSDIQQLIDYFKTEAKILLLTAPDFDSFGANIDCDRKLITIYQAVESHEDDTVKNGLINSYKEQLAKRKIRAFGVASDVRIVTDRVIKAIEIQISHLDNENAISYIFTYNINNKEVEFLDSWTENAG